MSICPIVDRSAFRFFQQGEQGRALVAAHLTIKDRLQRFDLPQRVSRIDLPFIGASDTARIAYGIKAALRKIEGSERAIDGNGENCGVGRIGFRPA